MWDLAHTRNHLKNTAYKLYCRGTQDTMEAADVRKIEYIFSFQKLKFTAADLSSLIFSFVMSQGTLCDLMQKEMSLTASAFPIIDDGVSTLKSAPLAALRSAVSLR